MKNLFFLLFLVSCVSPNTNPNIKNKALNFNKDLTFDQFHELLIKYEAISSYPNID
tara:strand:+ start:212 stop:379 length:168 start_codon:yes stop_codon:yes gene_type:complete